ncbi:hypothetical protein KSU1_C1347 [Candidatus Jettenia caeni]|uniref:Uncharacterized protein n=1 Tax=Candidatus Jettenia caeni TaxID=247490 RepID=I3IMJ8_9BACT|nr:hypothetical protein KSU1_C1347 [Candidatus Jettenia caeni]
MYTVILLNLSIGLYRIEKVTEKLILVLKCDRMEENWVGSDLFEVTLEQGFFSDAGLL